MFVIAICIGHEMLNAQNINSKKPVFIEGPCAPVLDYLGLHFEGVDGFVIGDLDGDTTDDLLTTQTFASRHSWIVYIYDPARDEYRAGMTGPIPGNLAPTGYGIVHVASEAYNIILIADTEVYALKYPDPTPVFHVTVSHGARLAIAADVLGDAKQEMIISGDRVWIFDQEFNLIHTIIKNCDDEIEAGQLDTDEYRELVLEKGEVYEIREDTVIFEWDFITTSIGARAYQIELVEVDGEPGLEIVTLEDEDLNVYHHASRQLLRENANFSLHANVMEAYDYNLDGRQDIIVMDHPADVLRILDLRTWVQRWSFSTDRGPSCLWIGNADTDAQEEMLWLSGSSPMTLRFMEPGDIAVESEFALNNRPYRGIAFSDLNEDLVPEMVFCATNKIDVIDVVTQETIWSADLEFFESVSGGGFNDILVRSGKNPELLIAGSRPGEGLIMRVDVQGNDFSGVISADDTRPFTKLKLADMDGDGIPELIGGTLEAPSRMTGAAIYVFDVQTGAVKWMHELLTNNVFGGCSSIAVANVDGDPLPEIITTNDSLFILNADEIKVIGNRGYLAVEVFDITGDSLAEIIAGTEWGSLHIFSQQDFQLLDTIHLSHSPVFGLEVSDLNQNHIPELLCVSDSKVMAFEHRDFIYASPQREANLGINDGIAIGDADGDGIADMVCSSGLGPIVFPHQCFICLDFRPDLVAQTPDCNTMEPDGKAWVNIMGGTPPYSFTWNENNSVDTLSNVDAGYYAVTVLDASGCVLRDSIVLIRPDLDYNIVVTDVGCTGLADGGVIVNDVKGRPPYNFLWNIAGADSIITDLSIGTYDVTISDENGCIRTDSAIVQQAYLDIDAVMTQSLCIHDSAGSAAVIVVDGTSPFSYQWSVNATDSVIADLKGGIYTVSSEDDRGCRDTAIVEIIETELHFEPVQLAPACNGNFGAVFTYTVSEGVWPFQFFVSGNPVSDSLVSGFASDVPLVLTLVDNLGCSATDTITLPSHDFSAELEWSNPSCHGGNDGAIQVIVLAGQDPYNYRWNTGDSVANYQNLPAGNYRVTVTDAFGCRRTLSRNLISPLPLEVLINTTPDTIGGLPTGVIWFIVTGGVPPYSYAWQDSVSSNISFAQNLYAGQYAVTITDDNGCDTIVTAIVDGLTSIQDTEGLSDIVVFPNPALHNVFVIYDPGVHHIVRVRACDVTGRFVPLTSLPASINTLQVSFPEQYEGVVFLEVTTTDHLFTIPLQMIK